MPKRAHRRPATPPSGCSSDDDDGNFIMDPDQIFDVLPQPFRLINKTLDSIFDQAWEIIEGIEEDATLRRSKACLPTFDCGNSLLDLSDPSCVCPLSPCEAGYMFVAYSLGFAVFDPFVGQTVATLEDAQGKNIVQMSSYCLQDGIFLVCSVDDAGTAKVFCFGNGQILLVRTFNEQEGPNKQAVASGMQFSPDGGYIGIGWEVPNKESWLEVYKIPKDTWIKEIEASATVIPRSRKPTVADAPPPELLQVEMTGTEQQQPKQPTEEQDTAPTENSPPGSRPGSAGAPSQVVASFTKPAAVLRIRPPAPVGPCSASNCATALKSIDADGSVIGSGANHVLLPQFFKSFEGTFQALHQQQLQYLQKQEEQQLSCTPTFHFLRPGRLVPSGQDTSPNKSNSIAVWWSRGTQLFIYSLVKSAKADIEHKPDVVWPNAKAIRISAVSDCQTLLALGLDSGIVVVWDMHRGVLLRTCTVSETSEVLSCHFLSSSVVPQLDEEEQWVKSGSASYANLVVSCSNGKLCLVQSRVASSPSLVSFTDSSSMNDGDIVMRVQPFPNVPQVIAAIKKGGIITLYDVTTFAAIGHVRVPAPYVLSPAVSTCFCANELVIVLKGYQMDKYNEEINQETGLLFTYPLQSFPVLDQYLREPMETQPFITDNTVEKQFHSLIQDRLTSQGARQLRLQHRWSQFSSELKKSRAGKTRINHSAWLTASVTS